MDFPNFSYWKYKRVGRFLESQKHAYVIYEWSQKISLWDLVKILAIYVCNSEIGKKVRICESAKNYILTSLNLNACYLLVSFYGAKKRTLLKMISVFILFKLLCNQTIFSSPFLVCNRNIFCNLFLIYFSASPKFLYTLTLSQPEGQIKILAN